jgi:moderate conductance mechanosensitive channel
MSIPSIAPLLPAPPLDTQTPWAVVKDWSDAMQNWLGHDWQSQVFTWMITKPLAILVLVLAAVILRWFLHRLIVTSIMIFTIFGITIIAELGYPVGPLIASAGVVGVALGFGAQSLVKDFLAGICMIFEDQYGVGDAVDLGEASGTVEAVGLRVTRLRDVEGTVWYVRNGEIIRVGNQSQNWARTVLDIPVALNQDLQRVQQVLRDVAQDLWDDEDFHHLIIEEPSVWGVQDLTPNWVTVRVTLKTAPLEQWAVAREMRQRIKWRFDHEGISFAPPPAIPWTQPA